jgi:hypothetical protein
MSTMRRMAADEHQHGPEKSMTPAGCRIWDPEHGLHEVRRDDRGMATRPMGSAPTYRTGAAEP